MRQPAPQVQPVLTHVSPNLADLVFFVSVDHRIPGAENVTYGDPYTGQNASKYPNHVLVYVGAEEVDQAGARWAKHYYAADRANQDTYNWEIDGDTLVRTYLVRRALYRQNPSTLDPENQLEGEFLWPPVAAADSAFSGYGFADDNVVRSDTELDSLFVLVRRRFLVPVQTNTLYDETIERNVSVTRELIGKGVATGASAAGITREREYGNYFHDWRVTSTVLLDPGDEDTDPEEYPLSMTSYIVDVPYRFPELLQGARINAAWAIADSDQAARSYDEAWYIDWKRVDPAIGPYEARVLRFLTDDPDGLRADYPVQKIIVKRETIGIARSWAHASSKGNSTYAEARQIEVPPAIHGELTIENGETLSVGQSTNTLPATPNFGTVVGQASMIIAYETKQTRFGLYIVEITQINCTGVYNGVVVPFGSQIQPGVDLPDMGANVPYYDTAGIIQPSVTVSADNTTVSGATSPGAAVKIFNGSTEVGRATAGTGGSYSLTLDTAYTDATSLTARAYLNGAQSSATAFVTYDLSPARPSGYLATDGSTLQGTSEPNALIGILVNASAQVETATIPAYYPQEVVITFAGTITVDGDIPVQWTSALVSETVQVPALTTDTMDVLAEKARALFSVSAVDEHWEAFVAGDDLIFRARISAADDGTAEAEITDPNGTGITPATSTNAVPGNSAPMTISTSGTIIATVTSGYASWSPINVSFPVIVGDDASDVAAKGVAALDLSQVGDDYTPAAVSNAVSLTELVARANDPSLNLVFTAGTAEGFVDTVLESDDTTPGGTGTTVVANGVGAYSYAFPVALSPGDLVQVTASDTGGTSLPLLLEASASRPTLSTAVLATTTSVTGTATVAAKIIVYVGDDEVGDAIVGGGGTYSVTLDYGMVRGEVLQVVAVVAGNEDVRSIPIFVTATDLNLEIPTFELTDAGYVGVAPAGATEIRIRRVSDLVETTATIHPNDNFVFTLAGEAAGAAFDVYARYSQGDSDSVRVFVPTIPKAPPFYRVWLAPVRSSWVPGSELDTTLGYTVQLPWAYKMTCFFQVWVDGMTVTVSFPGTAEDDIVITNCPGDVSIYDIDTVATVPLAYPNGIPDNIARVYLNIPLDMSGPAPIPYDSVKVTLTYPDGDETSTVFNASTFKDTFGHFIKGAWNYDLFLNPYKKREAEDYYASSY